MTAKDFVLEMLRHWQYQVEHNECTSSELQSICAIAEEHLVSEISLEEIKTRYNQRAENVRNFISRHLMEKDKKRKTVYNFKKILSNIPSKWLSGK
jgi:DNA polymerase III delta prime subunit